MMLAFSFPFKTDRFRKSGINIFSERELRKHATTATPDSQCTAPVNLDGESVNCYTLT
jgi:hypothetical protein